MRKTGYIAGTTLAAAVIGALLGALYGFAINEIGWWGAGLLLGLIIGPIVGLSVAERAA